jgi:hypothetical protein
MHQWTNAPLYSYLASKRVRTMTDILTTPKLWADWVTTRKVSIELDIPTNENLYDGTDINGYVFYQMVEGLKDALGIHLMGEADWKAHCASAAMSSAD